MNRLGEVCALCASNSKHFAAVQKERGPRKTRASALVNLAVKRSRRRSALTDATTEMCTSPVPTLSINGLLRCIRFVVSIERAQIQSLNQKRLHASQRTTLPIALCAPLSLCSQQTIATQKCSIVFAITDRYSLCDAITTVYKRNRA